jgi:hypothetical protein
MRRLSIVVVALVCMAAAGIAETPRPEITGVVPDSIAPNRTSQAIVVNGTGFAAGLSLTVTSPNGSNADYRGNAITEQRENSFRVSVLLEQPGAYRLVVVNPDAQSSLPFALTVKAAPDGPAVTAITPSGLRTSTSPQTLSVEGARFEAGLFATVTNPAGNVQTLGGDAISNLTPTGFQLTVLLDTAGSHQLVVTNRNGQASKPAAFEVARAGKFR